MAKRKRRRRRGGYNPWKQSKPAGDFEEGRPVVKAAILEVVENQLRDNEPPETQETYRRLQAEGYSDQEARELIGAVVTGEIYEVMNSKQLFDQERYVAALQRLPKLLWE